MVKYLHLKICHLTAKLGIYFAFSNGVAERRHCKQKVKAFYRIQKNLLIIFTVFYPQIGNFISHLTLGPVYILSILIYTQIWNISYSRWCKNRFCSSFTTTAMCSFILVWYFLEIFQFAGTLIVCRPTKTTGISRDKVSIFLIFLSLATTRFDYGQIFSMKLTDGCPSIGPRTTDTQRRNLKF